MGTKFFFIVITFISLLGIALLFLIAFDIVHVGAPVQEGVFFERGALELSDCGSRTIKAGEEERLVITINRVIDSDQKNYEILLNYFKEKNPDFNSQYHKLKVFYSFVSKGELQQLDLKVGEKIKCSADILKSGKATSLDYAVFFAGLAQAGGFESAVFFVRGYLGKEVYVMPGVKVDETTPEIEQLGGDYYFMDEEGNRYLLITPFLKDCFFSCNPNRELKASIFKID